MDDPCGRLSLGAQTLPYREGGAYLVLERDGPLLRIEPVNRVLKSHVT